MQYITQSQWPNKWYLSSNSIYFFLRHSLLHQKLYIPKSLSDAQIKSSQVKSSWQMSFICHIHNYTEYNEEWKVFSAFNPSKCTHLEQWVADCAAPGDQSWTSCRSRDSNPKPWVTSGFKSKALSTRPRLTMTSLFYNVPNMVIITLGYTLLLLSHKNISI